MRSLLALSAVTLLLSTSAHAAVGTARQAELLYLLKHDCGSCHGMRRHGGLGSPLEPASLAGRSTADLAVVILDGVPGTPMPPWRPFLTPDEARWLAGVLRDGRGMP